MSLIQVLLSAEAAMSHQAVRRTAFRHRTIHDEPMVVTLYNLSGEAAAPLGFCYGTDPTTPTVVISAEPRNRESRFKAINAFCEDLALYFRKHHRAKKSEDGKYLQADQAPQIVTPNRATRDFLGARLGRSLRYLGLGNTHSVPQATRWMGSNLSWLAEHTLMPGQSAVLAATELLSRHYATGQSSLEDENLASLLAWIENQPGSGLERIRAAESSAYGPVPDPKWEETLEPLVRAWTQHHRDGDTAGVHRIETRVEGMVREALAPAYEATHRALEIARALPEAPRVSARWAETDVRQWSNHLTRAMRKQEIPRFAKRHNALRAAQMLEVWSNALAKLEYEEAMDDPLIMAEHDANGRCLTGTVIGLDLKNKEIKPGNSRRSSVPLILVGLEAPTMLLPGEEVTFVGNDKIKALIRKVEDGQVTLAAIKGHSSGTLLPPLGSKVRFVALSLFEGRPPAGPDEVPWTHKPSQEELADIVKGEGSPDLSADELAELPAGAGRSPDSVSGVVQ